MPPDGRLNQYGTPPAAVAVVVVDGGGGERVDIFSGSALCGRAYQTFGRLKYDLTLNVIV